ncbi:MAG: 5-nucleotidase, partial [Actinomycetota bacterium]|nr:5-nucleotidase [Actinomycetota bacterium]
IIDYYKPFASPIANRKLGFISSDLTRVSGPFDPPVSGESQMGDLIADAQVEDPTIQSQGPVQIAFMNPGGIRANLSYAQDLSDGDAEGDGVVTFGEAFTVQPFNNYDVSLNLTGAQIEQLLEQQFDGTNHINLGASNWKILQVSKGFSYSYDSSRPAGDFIDPATITLNGTVLDPGTTYRVECNSFLSDGGDGFGVFAGGQNKLFGGLDIDALALYLGNHTSASAPYVAPALTRITRTG